MKLKQLCGWWISPVLIHCWLGLLGVALPVAAAPQLSVQQRSALNGVCSGAPAATLSESSLQTAVLLYEPGAGAVPAEHDGLPATLRAASFANAGLVVCVTRSEVTLETCNVLIFSFARVRRDLNLRVVPAREPQATLLSTRLEGGLPPACNAAGTIGAGTTAIKGAAPDAAAITAVLDSVRINRADADADGLDNLSELIQRLDPLSAASPGALLTLTTNNARALRATTGEALTVKLTFKPGQYLGHPTDYYLWAESRDGIWSYIHPGQFVPAPQPLLSARAKAIVLDEFPVLQFQQLNAGDYTLHFEVRIDGSTTYATTASITVAPGNWHFADVTAAAGLVYTHGYAALAAPFDIARDRQYMAAGVAAGDYDRDGWIDLYITRGSIGPNLLYRNRGDGTFEDVAQAAGVAVVGEYSGATFADYDGDGWPDLLVAGINTTTQPLLFRNRGDGTFVDATAMAGIPPISQAMSSAFGDYDRDGDLDFWMTHWTASAQQKYLWRNDSGVFTDVSAQAGIPNDLMADYSANFADIDNDGWPDILIAGDFSTSQVWINRRNGTFANTTTSVVKGKRRGGSGDENGMGAAVGDYDNDGDLDWFVSSIFDTRPEGSIPGASIGWGVTGNRFYRNLGGGVLADYTSVTGTREGGWGWGSCFADFDNDGFLDLFHVNGYDSADPLSTVPFRQDPSRLFVNNHEGGFTERAAQLGITDNGQGRGIVCFDYDRDGDLDLFVANNRQAPVLYENRGLPASRSRWLHVRVAGENLNSAAIGARVYVTAGGVTQMRELSAGSNYMSQNPPIAYFGLGTAGVADTVRVVWPSGAERILTNVGTNQSVLVVR